MEQDSHEKGSRQNLPSINEVLRATKQQGIEKFNSLDFNQQLELVLEADGNDRLRLLQLSNNFEKLVRAMPAPEVLFTYEEVGIENALPVIAATSHDQFTFLTDLFCWDNDIIDSKASVEWIEILADCGDFKIRDWLNRVDPEWFIVLFKSLVNIYKIDEEGEIPDYLNEKQIFTLDGVYYFECVIPRMTNALHKILTIFRDEHPESYGEMMEAVIWSDFTEIQSHAAHFRQSRLAEWGFPDLDEALEIYQYFTPAERKTVVEELEKELKEWAEFSAAPHYPIKFQDRTGFLADCLPHVHDQPRLARFANELMLLANKVQVADAMKELGVLENIIRSSQKTTGLVTLGLAELSGGDPQKAAELVGRVHTERLFQIGFSQVQDLARKAKKLAKQAHITRNTHFIEELESPDREILIGLLKPQPKYFIGKKYISVEDYEEFQEPGQVEQCWQVLQRLEEKMIGTME